MIQPSSIFANILANVFLPDKSFGNLLSQARPLSDVNDFKSNLQSCSF